MTTLNDEARRRFLRIAMAHNTKTVANFNADLELAKRIVDAEMIGLKIDPDSVEYALKNILGVE